MKDKGNTTTISPISYKISGPINEHILKIQWKNAGFVQHHTTSDSNDFIDMQIWLYETDNHIEIHFGDNKTSLSTYGHPVATSNPNPSPSIALRFDKCSNVLFPNGSANLPSYGFYDACLPNYYFIDGTPSGETVYNFLPTATGIDENNNIKFSIYPNPFSEQLTISFPDNKNYNSIEVLDLSGKLLKKVNISSNPQKLERNNLAQGMYILRLIDNSNNIANKRIVVK